MEKDTQTGQQQQSSQPTGRMIEVVMNDGTVKLVPWYQIENLDIRLPSGKKINLDSNDTYTPSECFINLVGGKSFGLQADYAVNFLSDLQSQGFYQPKRIDVKSPQHAGAGSHSGR
jgi:hypothetical protein